ncbi:MAG: phosphoribosyltransferase family protein [Candidatus Shapirobacteria bacterium]|jgi:ComF family protein|nr:phosphoribosyltransferase family protein [Candidatus Shapirobacteria bacterium]
MSLIIDWLFPRKCFGCGQGEGYLCSLCETKIKNGELIKKNGFEGIISIYKYDGVIKNIIEKIKYGFVSDASEEMAQKMARKLKIDYPNIVEYWQKEKYCLLPIPLHQQRQRWRGFNQSEILAEKLSKILKLKYKNNIIIRKLKIKNQAQIKNREEKWKNMINVFEIATKGNMPKKVILVDDVITSGATMTAALKTLKNSGTNLGWGLTLAGVQK